LEERTFTYVALALLVWAISGTVVAGYYFSQYNIYQYEYENLANEFNTLSGALGDLSDIMESISLRVDILVGYGNGTKIWYNKTALPLASTAFTSILAIADIEYSDYGGDLGILVTSINGLASDSTNGWFYWYWDADKAEWILPEYSCAKYILHRGDSIAFTYESYMKWPPPQPT
jgi:hypothetical protein